MPVAFDKHPAVAAMHPPVIHPVDPRPRRLHPGSRHPDISVAIPSVVASGPDIACAGSYRTGLHDSCGRTDCYDYFR